MPPPLLHSLTAAPLPPYCEPASPFLASISAHLHICLPSYLALISSVLGSLSFLSWLFAQLPQVYKNYQLKSTSGLSLFFLVEWCLGDTTNLFGAMLTRQAGWQVVVAGYYVLVDVTLVFQFFWYTHYRQLYHHYSGLHHLGHDEGTPSALEGVSPNGGHPTPHRRSPPDSKRQSDAKDIKGPLSRSYSSQSPSFSHTEKLSSSSRRTMSRANSGPSPSPAFTQTLLITSLLCAVAANAAPTEVTPTESSSDQSLELIGRILSWMSTFLYLFSRPPQLYKNYCRKSTSGLSPLLFAAAFCGNLFYSSSLLFSPNAWYDMPPYGGGGWADADGNNRLEWLGRSIPFFLGAFGVLFFDGFMGVQFLMYGAKDEESMIAVEDPKRGRSKWTRVRGWMRGWIPSVSPERDVIDSSQDSSPERQTLLGEGQERYGAV